MFPSKYIERIQSMLPQKELDIFFGKVTKPLPKTIRLSNKFDQIPEFWHLKPVAQIPNTYFITRDDQETVPLGKTLEHFTGKMYVASLSSLLPPLVLNPQPGDRVFDICAAPGSKTTFLAELMDNQGTLIANEPSSTRSKKLVSNLERMGVLNAVVLQSDGTKLSNFFEQQFDKILLDAPCSSEGFARKDSKFFDKMWSEKKIFEAAKLQKKLISAAFEILAPGGAMVYSTCTSAPEENEFVIQFLLEKYGEAVEILPINFRSLCKRELARRQERLRDFEHEQKGDIPTRNGLTEFNDQKIHPKITKNVIRIWPHLETDGWSSESFFIAKIQKKTPLRSLSQRELSRPQSGLRDFRHKQTSISILPKNRTAEIVTYLHKKFGIEKSHLNPFSYYEKNGDIWMIAKDAAGFLTRNQFRRAGMKILDRDRNITSTFAIHFGVFATKNVIKLSIDQKDKWLEGLDLNFEARLDYPDGTEVLVRFDDFCLGHGKVMKEGKKLKNKLDRDLVF